MQRAKSVGCLNTRKEESPKEKKEKKKKIGAGSDVWNIE